MDLNLESLFGDADLDIECPGCGHQFPVKLKEVMHEGNEVQCPSCKESIGINHEGGTAQELKKADKALKDLEKTLKNFGK